MNISNFLCLKVIRLEQTIYVSALVIWYTMTDIQELVIFVFCHEMSKNGFVSHVCTTFCTTFYIFKTQILCISNTCRTFASLKTLEWKARLVWNGLDTYEIADTKGNLTRDQWSRSDLVRQAVNRRSWDRNAIYYLSLTGWIVYGIAVYCSTQKTIHQCRTFKKDFQRRLMQESRRLSFTSEFLAQSISATRQALTLNQNSGAIRQMTCESWQRQASFHLPSSVKLTVNLR